MAKVVVAFGGNAILKKGQKGTAKVQMKNLNTACRHLVKMIKKGHKIVITHGNGPQVGNILLQNEYASKKVSPMPLDVCGAESQGLIGYMIQQTLKNNINKEIATLTTQVLVSKKDKAFKNPTKPVGPFYTKKQAQKLKRKYKIKKDPHGGYRRVVPSPRPLKIIEEKTIKKLVDSGVIVITSGGGGIPVIKTKKGLKGVEAVIDKDLSAQVLAKAVKANILLILTDIEKVALNFNKKNQKFVNKLTLKQAKKYLKQGHFLSGSMKPKINAAIKHLESGGKKTIICSLEQAELALQGKAGTTISRV